MAYGTEEEPPARVGGARGGLTSRGSRLRSAGGFIFVSMVAVALLGLSPRGREPTSLQAKLVDLRVHSLATELLANGDAMSGDAIEKRVRHAALLDNGGLASHMQMLLANQPSWLGGRGRGEGDGESLRQDMADMASEMLADPSESKLCPKQAVIRDKLDELLAKLAAQTIIANETNRKLYLEYVKARGDYYDEGGKWGLAKQIELRDNQKKDFDRIKFMLYEDVMKRAEEKFIEVQNRTMAHEKELSEEQKLIRQLINMIDHMHAIESSEGRQQLKGNVQALIMLAKKQTHAGAGGKGERALSKAAGLVSMDVADMEAHKGELGDLVGKLSKLSSFLKDTQMSQLAGGKVQSLKSFEESSEVRKILEEMLEEAGKQLEILKEEIEDARRDVEESRKKMESWRKSMVDNRDDADDEGKKKDEAAPLRLKDEGDYVSAKERYEDNHKLYVKILNPYERQIYIIMMVKKKIKEHCEKIGA